MVWKVCPSNKVHAGSHCFDGHLIGMELETKTKLKECTYLQKHCFQLLLVVRENHKVISVADIVFGFDLMLHKLVELVHIDVDQQLARKIAER